MVAVVLVIVVFVLAIIYYWRPAATEALNPRWWQWVLMSLLFFAAVAVSYHRHRSRNRAALHEALAAQREEMATEAHYQPITDGLDGASSSEGRKGSPEAREGNGPSEKPT